MWTDVTTLLSSHGLWWTLQSAVSSAVAEGVPANAIAAIVAIEARPIVLSLIFFPFPD
jgi:hypothetical protein